MALFKISKGNASDLPSKSLSWGNGYAWFTQDDGKFYIDYYNGDDTQTPLDESKKIRQPLNAEYADKLGYSTVGSTSQPIYLNNGVPTAIAGALGNDITGNAATATKATQDANGNVITSTYLPLSGGTMTGTLYLPGGNPIFSQAALQFAGGAKIGQGASSSSLLGIYSPNTIVLRPGATTAAGTEGIEITTDGLFPTNNNTENLGLSDHKWANVYANNLYLTGNANLNGETIADSLTAGNLEVTGSASFVNPINGDISGNAGTATKLQTPRTINGIAFDGTSNINTPFYYNAKISQGSTAAGWYKFADYTTTSSGHAVKITYFVQRGWNKEQCGILEFDITLGSSGWSDARLKWLVRTASMPVDCIGCVVNGTTVTLYGYMDQTNQYGAMTITEIWKGSHGGGREYTNFTYYNSSEITTPVPTFTAQSSDNGIVDQANKAATATKVNHKLTIGTYEFDGSSDVTIPIYNGATA